MSVDPLKVRNAIRRMRREEERLALAIGAEVTKLVEHLFWDTQWVKGDRPLRAWVFVRHIGRVDSGQAVTRKLRGARELEYYGGITEDGVVNEVYVGLSTTSWECVPVEDALLILADVKQILKRKNKAELAKVRRAAKERPREVAEVTWR